MRVHFLTTKITADSGGAIYDQIFYHVLAERFPQTKLLDDLFFLDQEGRAGRRAGLLDFNAFYHKHADYIFDCEYLIVNSRLYTRFMGTDIRRYLQKYPRVKLLVIHHHNNYMSHKGVLYLIHRHFEMRIIKAATDLVIPNQYVIDQLKKLYHLQNITCLPSSFEKRSYKISLLDTGNILFVGSVEKRKGLLYGLKAFGLFYETNKNYKFRIAGRFQEKDPYYKKLQAYIRKNALTEAVVFEGRVTEERLAWLYSNSDLFLFPSLLEGYGWVMIEAMGRGVPVVAFDNSAMPYSVRDGFNGALIENLNWKEMAAALGALLSDREKLRKLQELVRQMDAFIGKWK